jgi:HPt (histidine-containing phosphotransfer) domain-containing protein
MPEQFPSAQPATPPDFEARLAELRRRFVERTRRDGETVRRLRERLLAGEPLCGDLLRDLCRTVHGLAGAAGVFGFDEISEAAHRAEVSLRSLDGPPTDPQPLLDALEIRLASIG